MAEAKKVKVVMTVIISGDRYEDGVPVPWPGFGETLETTQADADQLIGNSQAITPAAWAKLRKTRG